MNTEVKDIWVWTDPGWETARELMVVLALVQTSMVPQSKFTESNPGHPTGERMSCWFLLRQSHATNSAVIEQMPREVKGLNPAGCWAFFYFFFPFSPHNITVECPKSDPLIGAF